MDLQYAVPIYVVALFFGMRATAALGRRQGERSLAQDPTRAEGSGPVEAAIFGLFGLLVAFTFGGGAERMNARRQLVVQEANVIGTAYLRIDLLPASQQPALREMFRNYVDGRLATYRMLSDVAAAEAELQRTVKLQVEIWRRAVAGCGGTPPCANLLLPAINEMIDIVGTRTAAARTHTPTLIFALLFLLAIGCSLLAGYGMAGNPAKGRLYVFGFIAITVLTIYVILDVEYPRWGLIRLDEWDRVLVEVRESMK